MSPSSTPRKVAPVLAAIWGILTLNSCGGDPETGADGTRDTGGSSPDGSGASPGVGGESGGSGGLDGVGGNSASAGGGFGSGGSATGGAGTDAAGGATSGGAGSGGAGAGGSGSGGEGTGGASAEPRDLTIYIAGDSIVSTYADTPATDDMAGWGQMLPEIFDDHITVVNRAQGGRTARWFHLEGAAQWVLDRMEPGDYFFIEFGTNDSHPSATFEVDGVTYERFAAADGDFQVHLKDFFLDPTRAIDGIPVLVTPPPRNSAYCGTGNSLAAYAQAMRELGEQEDVAVLDLNQKTFDHLSAICPSPSPEDFFAFRGDGSVDGTHFQENGARQMAGFLGAEIARLQLSLSVSLLP